MSLVPLFRPNPNNKNLEFVIMEPEEFEITGVVDEYITDCMENGTTLMKNILLNTDITKMSKYTYWKKDFQLCTLNDFGNSVLTPQIHQITTAWAIKKMQKFIDSDKRAIAIFEERIVDSSDVFLADPDTPPYFISEMNIYKGKEVYYLIDQKYCTMANIKSSFSLSGRAGPFSSTALIILPDGVKVEPGSQISKKILENLSSNVKHLIFGAFDLDGYIFCSSGIKL